MLSLLVLSSGFYLYTQRVLPADKEPQNQSTQITYHQIVCPNGTSDAGYTIKSKPVCEISNIITNDLHLTNDRYWKIKGEVQIGGDNNFRTNLFIDPGTVLFGSDGGDFMVINRGSKIIAKGEASRVITFTSESDVKELKASPGDWGGLVIAGNAPINTGNFDEEFEFSSRKTRFGGDKADDNSGILKYVIIKYAGDQVYANKELNGLSLGGVGSGTLINYLEVYYGKDDGIEVWGGTVNMKHIILIGNRDDSLDTDMGYNGFIQYLYAEKFSVEANQAGYGIESDNNPNNYAAKPVTNPILQNFEFLGSMGSEYGIVLRHGSGFTLINGIVSNFEKAQISIQDAQTLQNDKILFKSIALYASEENKDLFYGKNEVSETKIQEMFLSSKHCKTNTYTTTPTRVKVDGDNGFFDEANFVGAYQKENDWRFGWSIGLEKY